MMTEKDLYNKVFNDCLGDSKSMLNCLCDGKYLSEIGIEDEDQPTVENVYAHIKSFMK